jgi:hypothetical protein
MNGSAVTGVMVHTPVIASHPDGMLKEIVSRPACALASIIACRNEPVPLSAVFVTTKTAAEEVCAVTAIVSERVQMARKFLITRLVTSAVLAGCFMVSIAASFSNGVSDGVLQKSRIFSVLGFFLGFR